MASISLKDRLGIVLTCTTACAMSFVVVTAQVPDPTEIVARTKPANQSEKSISPNTSDGQKRTASPLWKPETFRFRFQGSPKPEEPIRPPVVAAAEVTVAPPLPFQLTGTILEDQERFAVVRDNGGREFVVREGESIAAPYEAISLKSVDARSAVFLNAGAEQTLTMKPPADLRFE